jgi:predicted DsbA family dithiol-disulfide isomerase
MGVTMTQQLKIDFVSDKAFPSCVIGLRVLERALATTTVAVEADIISQPFEPNPGRRAGSTEPWGAYHGEVRLHGGAVSR